MFHEYRETDRLSEALQAEDRWNERDRCNPPEQRGFRAVPHQPGAVPIPPLCEQALVIKLLIRDGKWTPRVECSWRQVPVYIGPSFSRQAQALEDAVHWIREQTAK